MTALVTIAEWKWKKTFKIQNIKAKCKNTEHSKTQLGTTYFKLAQVFQQWKKCENGLRFDKVIESIKVGTFFETQCILSAEIILFQFQTWLRMKLFQNNFIITCNDGLRITTLKAVIQDAFCSKRINWRQELRLGERLRSEHNISMLLFRPPGPAAAGRVGLYILLLYFYIFFWHRNL